MSSTTPDDSKPAANAIATTWLAAFNKACSETSNLGKSDDKAALNGVLALFLPDGFWRDRLCLTWNYRTSEGTDQLSSFLSHKHTLAKAGIKNCVIDDTTSIGGPAYNTSLTPSGPLEVVEFPFTFELTSPPARAKGFAKLAKDPSSAQGDSADATQYKAHILYTALDSINGHEEDQERPLGHYNGHTESWDTFYADQVAKTESNPTVLIVGGGHVGVMCAVRLKKLGVNVLIIERKKQIGDTWRDRYDLLTLQTTVKHLEFPYLSYPPNTPVFMPKTKFADFMQFYVLSQELVVWTSTTMIPHPTYDRSTGQWTVKVLREGKELLLKPKHLVMATGIMDMPQIPKFNGLDQFTGPVMHSKDFKTGDGWKGKKVVVIGAGVSGNDIALEADSVGAETLMVQRSSMCVIRSSTGRHVIDQIWPPSRPVEDSDFLAGITPLNLFMRILPIFMTPALQASEKDVHDGLRKQGFLVGWGEEVGLGAVGIFGLIYAKLGGYSLDVGCAQRIIDGRVKVKSGVEIETFDKTGIKFSDGSRVDADVVVLATGFLNMRARMIDLLSEDIVNQTSDIWGLDKEGEIKGVFRPTGHPGLFYVAGSITDTRILSKFLALQILGRELGLVQD